MNYLSIQTVQCCIGCDHYRSNTLIQRCKKYNIESKPYEVCGAYKTSNTLKARLVPCFTTEVLEDMINDNQLR